MSLDERAVLAEHQGSMDAIVDPFEKPLCARCMEHVFPDTWTMGSSGPLNDGRRTWWFERLLTPEERGRILAYLEDPRCTPEAHAPFEARILEAARVDEAVARSKRVEIEGRPAGWSIERP